MSTSPAASLALRFWPVRPRMEDPLWNRVAELFRASEAKVVGQTHRVFARLLPAQAAVALVLATFAAPHLWTVPPPVPHLVLAIAVGTLLVAPALALMRWRPEAAVTRQAVALAQVGFSALFIHLTGGRGETHFHVFVSLAILALYRDWRVLPTATAAILIDHVVRSRWAPESLFGVAEPLAWRSLEHLGWVLFADAVLIAGCVIARREMWRMCERQEHQQRELEQRVLSRTRDLEAIVVEYQHIATELRDSEQRHRSLIASMPIGIFETAASGAVLLANPYLLRLLGLPEDIELSKINMADGRIFAPAERARFWQHLQTDGEALRFTTRLHRVDGTVLDVVINARLKAADATGELTCKGTLEDITARRQAEHELAALNQQLVVASRQAGMAEVATGVLHNIGNVLTSVNLIVHDAQDRLKSTRLSHLHRVVEVLQREQPRLGEFLTTDPGGRQLPEFLARLDTHLVAENARLLGDVEDLVRHCEHIREIIVTQQSSARLFGVIESVAPSRLFDDALRLHADSFERHGIALVRDYGTAPDVQADRHRVLQILVNLCKNSKQALQALPPAGARRIVARITVPGADTVALCVEDNGPGLPPETLARLFQHGFTTTPGGHGFGLHSSVLAAREMGGDLTAASAGPGLGATFTLTLPRSPAIAP